MEKIDIEFANVFDGISGLSHGFFGRAGGVYKGLYKSLNTGQGSGDCPQNVHENRRRVAALLGVKGNRLVTNHQIHSPKVITLESPPNDAPKQADGMVTNRPGLALSVLTADCAPVLFCDPKAKVIGAAHAGWRGALAGVTDETIKAMCKLGAERRQIRAAIGPCISGANYEVGEDFISEFITDNLGNRKFFKQARAGKARFDIKSYLLARLKKQGLKHIEALRDCTYGAPERYFSFRYNTHQGLRDYGRNISVIILQS